MDPHVPSVSELIRAASAPCLVIREEDLDLVRQKRDKAEWAGAFDRLASEAEGWIGEAVEVPDRGGQWPHWYACEADGSRLVTEAPTIHRCPKCGRVYSGEPWDSVPLTEAHNVLSRAVLTLGVYHALTGSGSAAEKACEILTEYADRYPHYPVRGASEKPQDALATKVSWGTLGESVWLIPICGGYDLVRDAGVLSPAEHQSIREQLMRPAARLILRNNVRIHSMQCWHIGAIGAAGLLLRDRDLVSFALEAESGIRNQIARGILSDGSWFEGSWGYHFQAMSALLGWAEALRNCGLDLYDEHFKRLFEAPFAAARTAGRLPAVHDSDGLSLADAAPHYEMAYARYGVPQLAWPLARSERRDLNALLYGRLDLPQEIPEVTGSTHLGDSGFVYLRQGPSESPTYLALDYGRSGDGHGHPDKLGFVLCRGKQMLAPDPGSVAYGIPLQEKWFRQTVSHNTMVVDGQSQAPCVGQLDLLVNGPDFDLASVHTLEAYDGVRMSRTMLLMDDLVLLIDRLASDLTHTYDWVYHNRGSLRTGVNRERMAEPPGKEDGYDLIQDPRIGIPEGDWHAVWRAGQAGVRLIMMASKLPTEVITGRGWDNSEASEEEPGAVLAPLVVVRRRSRRRSTFRAALQVFGKRPPPASLTAPEVMPVSRGRGVTLTRGRSELTLITTINPGPVSWGDVEFDGDALFAHLRGRVSGRIVLAHGKRLTWGDQTWTLRREASVQFERSAKGVRMVNLEPEAVEVETGGTVLSVGPQVHAGGAV